MIPFFQLVPELKEESDPARKRRLLTNYFCSCDPEEIDPALAYLSGKKEKPIFSSEELAAFASEYLQQPIWMIETSIKEVGDVSEAIALLTGNLQEGLKKNGDDRKRNGKEVGLTQSENVPDGSPHNEIRFLISIVEEIRSHPQSQRSKDLLFSLWNSASVPEKIFLHLILLGKRILKVQDSVLLFVLADCFNLETGVLLEKAAAEGNPWKSTSVLKTLSLWFPDRNLNRLSLREVVKRIDPSLPQTWNEPLPFPDDKNAEGLSFFLIPRNAVLTQIVFDSFGIAAWTKDGYLYRNQIPQIIEELSQIQEPAVFIGWVSAKQSKSTFEIYDILNHDQKDLSNQTIAERRNSLDSIFKQEFRFVSLVKWNLVPPKSAMRRNEIPSQSATRKPTLFSEQKQESAMQKITISSDHSKSYAEPENPSPNFGEDKTGIFNFSNAPAFVFHPGESQFFLLKPPVKTIKAALLYGRKSINAEGSSFWELSFGIRNSTDRSEGTVAVRDLDSSSVDSDLPLVTIARIVVDSGQDLFAEFDSFFKENTIERKGPIRGVPTTWKAVLSFQNLVRSKRHKIGFFLEDVRIQGRISSDQELDDLQALIDVLV
ncbi:hypothetical protein DLM76_04305 [Leptospira yasudae]|uniref:hypothetical protein n=1 Tax=Leptospira yasudae TaxID=2202201 RepID=UPI000E59C496|nr:hypothetical protein [Leptospira yasudae]RHX96184.1 hypothetical protein DLM76_04305 [Leptospira yasudae]